MISSPYDKVFLSYDKILELFKINNITTKHGKTNNKNVCRKRSNDSRLISK